MPIPEPVPYPPLGPEFDPIDPPTGEWDTVMQQPSGPNAGVWYQIRWHLGSNGLPVVKTIRVTSAPDG